jgi:hypothetical protein
MLFLTKVKPNLHCMIFGCSWCQWYCYEPYCLECKQYVEDYIDKGYWPSLELDNKLNGLMWRIERLINNTIAVLKYRKSLRAIEAEDEIPF